MHYKNGREAKVGDAVVCRDYNGLPLAGVVVKTLATTNTCNLQVVPIDQARTFTASECLHIDDAMELPDGRLPSRFQIDNVVSFTSEGPDGKKAIVNAVKFTGGKVLYDLTGCEDGIERDDVASDYVHPWTEVEKAAA